MSFLLKKNYSFIKKMSPAVKASFLFTVCSIFQKGISFFVVPIYTRLMSVENYGQYSVFLSWYELITIFTTLNMWNYLINNGLIKYKNDRENFVAALQGLSAVITVIWIIIYFLFQKRWEAFTNLTFPMMLLMFCELLFRPSYEYYCAVKRFDYEAKNVVILTVLITLFTPIVSIPLIITASQKGLAAIFAKVIVPTTIYLLVFFRLICKNHKLYNKKYWIFALKFNLPLIPHFLSMMILQQSDRIMIERICGEYYAAIYSVAYQLASTLYIVNAAILNSYIPYTYKAIKNNNISSVKDTANSFIFLIGVLSIFVILIAPEIISILAPREYMEAIYVIPPVAISNLFMFLFNLFANVEYFWGKTNYVAIASFFSAILNIFLNYIFINKFGFIAAGYTTLICYILFSMLHYFFMKRVSKQYMGGISVYKIKNIFFMMTGFTFFGLLINFTYECSVIRYMLVALMAIFVFLKRENFINLKKAK